VIIISLGDSQFTSNLQDWLVDSIRLARDSAPLAMKDRSQEPAAAAAAVE